METKQERSIRKKSQTVRNNLLKKQKRLALKEISDKKKEQIEIERKANISSFEDGQSLAIPNEFLNEEHASFGVFLYKALESCIIKESKKEYE